jgi:hypothetical protein
VPNSYVAEWAVLTVVCIAIDIVIIQPAFIALCPEAPFCVTRRRTKPLPLST